MKTLVQVIAKTFREKLHTPMEHTNPFPYEKAKQKTSREGGLLLLRR